MSAPRVSVQEALPSNLERFSSWMIGAWRASPLSTPFRVGAFAASFVLLGALRIVFGGYPQNAYPHDLFIFLDGAWRVLNGQRPQVDFNSNLGPLMYMVTGGGFQLTHSAVHAIAVAQVLFVELIAMLVGYIAFRRMQQIPAMLITIAAVLIAISPCNTGEEPFAISYAMIYNRVGFGLLAFILIEATQSPRAGYSATREELWGGLFSGFVVAFLFFLKITYAAMAIVLLVGLLPYRTQMRARFVGLMVGISGSVLAMLAYLGFHVTAVFHTLQLAGAARHILPEVVISRVTTYAQVIVALAAFAALSALLPDARAGNTLLRALRRAWAVTLVSVVALGLLLSNAQLEGLPLAAIMCLIVAAETISYWQFGAYEISLASLGAAVVVFVALLVPVANVLFWNTGAFAFSILRAAGFRNGGEKALLSPVASDFRTRQTFGINLQLEPYTDYLNDGLRLLTEHSSSSDSIVTLDFVNPFPFLLQRRPASAGTTCLHYLTTFDSTHHLSADELLGDAALVMWPKYYEEPRLGRGIEMVYADAVRQRYVPVAESSMWRLWRRKASTPITASR